jgi:hypothetical protein
MIASQPLSLKRLLFAATILSGPLIAMAPTAAAAQIGIEISVPLSPPMLPVYEQPSMPDLGYIWTPGYWSWSQPVGYYWVPGTWVLPPAVNVLWTPPYWDWSGGFYRFHEGYWGPHVGYYGGVNYGYGYGYGGQGYQGGRWQGTGFVYNRAVNNFGAVHVPNAYSSSVTVANNSHISYAGGTGGLRTAPSAGDRLAGQERHVPMTPEQSSHISTAARLPELAASHNGGHPTIAATARPTQSEGPGVVHAAPGGGGTPAIAPSPSTRPAANVAAPLPQHPGAPEAPRPAAQVAAPPADHGSAAPAQHDAARPDQRGAPPTAAPPAQQTTIPEVVRPAEHSAAPPAQHEAARPPEQRAAPPAERGPAQQPVIAHAAPPPGHAAPGEKEKER